jgi:tRNA modification GTPase
MVIAGKVNVGKSSLLNALLRQERAIVSERPGTTRDYIREMMDLQGTPVVVVDTAGIRPPGDEVEAEGVRSSERLIEEADLLLAVLDSSQPLDEDDRRVLAITAGRARVIVLNKWDLPGKCLRPDDCGLTRRTGGLAVNGLSDGPPTVAVSALKGDGMEQLRRVLAEALQGQGDALAEGVAVNLRHYGLLRSVENALERARGAVQQGLPLDQIASDLREASERLGEITGEVFTDEIIERIFSSFCLGK